MKANWHCWAFKSILDFVLDLERSVTRDADSSMTSLQQSNKDESMLSIEITDDSMKSAEANDDSIPLYLRDISEIDEPQYLKTERPEGNYEDF